MSIDAFGARLREETDIDQLTGDLVAAVWTTMQPETVSVWLTNQKGLGEPRPRKASGDLCRESARSISALGRIYSMEIKVGTFNLNTLFSRFNFRAHVDELPPDERDVTVTYEFDEQGEYWFRTFRGRLIQPTPEEQRQALAARIKTMDLDVLAVQEVEDIEALRGFVRFHLNGLYPNIALIEGNDARFIDVGLLSKFPIGAVTSWQHKTHSAVPSERVFARDLLDVEILDSKRSRRLMTLYVNHLTSQFVEPGEADPLEAAKRKAERRRRQAEKAAEIVERRMRRTAVSLSSET